MESKQGFVKTKCSKRKNAVNDFEEVIFTSRKNVKTKIPKADPMPDVSRTTETNQSHDLRKLRYEIIKFGTTGLDGVNKQASSVALAVSLGAKPPKRQFKNYKEILKTKKTGADPNIRQEQKRHYYVVGQKVIPAKPKSEEGVTKNFLDSYGKPGKPKFKRRRKE